MNRDCVLYSTQFPENSPSKDLSEAKSLSTQKNP